MDRRLLYVCLFESERIILVKHLHITLLQDVDDVNQWAFNRIIESWVIVPYRPVFSLSLTSLKPRVLRMKPLRALDGDPNQNGARYEVISKMGS